MTDALVFLNKITTRIRNRFILENTSWEIIEGQSWAVIGPNGSGKTSLTRVLSREFPVVRGRILYQEGFLPEHDIAYMSFESQKRFLVRESKKEEARYYSGRPLEFTSTKDVLLDGLPDHQSAFPGDIEKIAQLTGIEHLLQRNVTRLSTGEFRNVLIARTLMQMPRLLVLDEPFEGLDTQNRRHISDLIDQLACNHVSVIMVTHRINAIPGAIDNIICLKDNRVVAQGKRETLLDPDFLQKLYASNAIHLDEDSNVSDHSSIQKNTDLDELIRMENVSVTYNTVCVFKHLNWRVLPGESWMVTGPNGSGKSTLLSLVSGDNPQAYANRIFLFGKQRGTGESIWDIKKRIGLVSSEFHLRYQKEIPVNEVILSGFFDSVGLYRRVSESQNRQAEKWINTLGLESKTQTLFTHLSFGEQRLVLIARAMVKSPKLLILDEPCQGLDPENRKQVLELIHRIGQSSHTSIIYVTHHREEKLPCITHVLDIS